MLGNAVVQVFDIAVPVQQQNRLAGLHAAIHDAAAQFVRAFRRNTGLAGAHTEKCFLSNALEPIVLCDLINGVIAHKHRQSIKHFLRF